MRIKKRRPARWPPLIFRIQPAWSCAPSAMVRNAKDDAEAKHPRCFFRAQGLFLILIAEDGLLQALHLVELRGQGKLQLLNSLP